MTREDGRGCGDGWRKYQPRGAGGFRGDDGRAGGHTCWEPHRRGKEAAQDCPEMERVPSSFGEMAAAASRSVRSAGERR